MNTINWTPRKPKAQNMLLITAAKFKDAWEYQLYEVKRTEFEDKWYWGIFLDGEEWGCYSELCAKMYGVIKPL